MKRILFPLFASILAAAPAWAGVPRTEVRTPVELAHATEGVGTIEFRIPHANIEVVGGTGAGVRVTGTMETLHKDAERARLLSQGCGLAFRREGSTLVLEPRYPDGALGREARKGRLWFHLRLEVPSSLPFGLYSDAGDVVLKGPFGASLVVEAGHGDIRLEFTPAFREVDARTMAGHVRGFPETAMKRFYCPFGQRRLWLDPAGERTAYLKTHRGDITLQGKDTQ
jgi:hypothetical protein